MGTSLYSDARAANTVCAPAPLTSPSVTMSAAAATPKKAPKVKKVRKTVPPAHPTFAKMVIAAVTALDEKKGSSRVAIRKYILANYKVDEKKSHLIAKGVASGVKAKVLVQKNGVNGLFKLAEKEKKAKAAPKKKAAKSPKKATKAAKPKAKKSPKAKKPVAKKAKAVPKKKATPKKK